MTPGTVEPWSGSEVRPLKSQGEAKQMDDMDESALAADVAVASDDGAEAIWKDSDPPNQAKATEALGGVSRRAVDVV